MKLVSPSQITCLTRYICYLENPSVPRVRVCACVWGLRVRVDWCRSSAHLLSLPIGSEFKKKQTDVWPAVTWPKCNSLSVQEISWSRCVSRSTLHTVPRYTFKFSNIWSKKSFNFTVMAYDHFYIYTGNPVEPNCSRLTLFCFCFF